MNYILFSDQTRDKLLPLTFTRPVADIRIGIFTIREKWEFYLKAKTYTLTNDYLSKKFPLDKEDDNILINGSIMPCEIIIKELGELKPNQILMKDETIIAIRLKSKDVDTFDPVEVESTSPFITSGQVIKIENLWDIFLYNKQAIKDDFELITKGRRSARINPSNSVIEPGSVFIEKGTKIENSIINASEGPVYIGKDAHVMDGAIIQGPMALCKGSVIKMGAKIYGNTTVGPYSKVGGEVTDSVFFGYSSKAHDGFFGHSVIGEWCNIGADSNTSNLKNNYDFVKLWSYHDNNFINTSQQFCGTIMGDHSKCGINTMFNTGTIIGVNVNVFGPGFLPNFVPSFSWGGATGFNIYKIEKAVEVAKRVYERRDKKFDDIEEAILCNVYDKTHIYRKECNS